MTGEKQTIVNYVVEVSARERPWITWPDPANLATSEEAARQVYDSAAGTLAAREGTLRVRLVRRTAVITDEVLEENAEGATLP